MSSRGPGAGGRNGGAQSGVPTYYAQQFDLTGQLYNAVYEWWWGPEDAQTREYRDRRQRIEWLFMIVAAIAFMLAIYYTFF